ncbi:MHYT domain-containing protein [Spiribacter halobius]|nr:MHYT domain-containing protein [Spiribacter halobius]UEX79362.1 hypothetical protein LMH63_06900 [Spiribacter halobius]
MSNTLVDYSLTLVLLSYIVSVVGAGSALFVARHIRGGDGGQRPLWLALSALLLGGCAIWAMHFVGMLAYDPGIPVAYDGPLTAVSFLVPVLFTGGALYTVHRWEHSRGVWLAAGTVMGLGVAAMHYSGMAAMRMAATMSYNPILVAVSILIAIIASMVALYILLQWRGMARYLSAAVMGVAVCGMHYTGMAAMNLVPSQGPVDYFSGALSPQLMLLLVTLTAFAACVISVFLALNDDGDIVAG